MYKLPLHAILSGLLCLTAFILFSYARTDAVMAAIDGVSLYVYSKPTMDAASAQNSAVVATNFLNLDLNKCRDMSKWMFPKIGYLTTSPNCNIQFTTGWMLLPNGMIDAQKVNITAMDTSHAVNCTPGVFALTAVGGTIGSSFVSAIPYLTITGMWPHQTFQLNNGSLGGAWAVMTGSESHYTPCVNERAMLAREIMGNLSCPSENSQLCSCIYEFTNRMTNLSVVFPPIDPQDNSLVTVLQKGINTCQTQRRAMDVRTKWDVATQPLSHIVLVFTWTFLMNCLYHVLLEKFPGNQVYLYPTFVVTVVVFCHATLATGFGGGHLIMLTLWIPCSVVGAYMELAFRWGDRNGVSIQRGFLNPFTYGMCYGCLVVYSIIARGVTQQEHILAEIFLVPANTALYTLAQWYFSYVQTERTNNQAFATVYTHESYIMAVAATLLSACNALLIPYPSQQTFLLHFIFPVAFALIAAAIITWPTQLNIQRSVPANPGTSDYFHDQGGILLFLVGVAFLGLALQRHTQVYLSLRASNSFPTVANFPDGVETITLPGMIKHLMM